MWNICNKKTIINHLNRTIENKDPFSLIRFGDGGLKMMISYIHNNIENLEIISNKEGIPIEELDNIMVLWAVFANKADYIDTPYVYEHGFKFWKRYKKDFIPINKKTNQLLKDWSILYKKIKIEVKNRLYCNPEFNWISILNYSPNLLDIMKDRKICFISVFENIPNLSSVYDVDFVQIVGHYEDQYKYSFKNVISYIEDNIDKYDLWLNSSGELGRVYSGRIKELGGRVIDMGFVAQYWYNMKRPERFNKFMIPDTNNPLLMKLTQLGEKYKGFI
jgi:hypothetical protein